MEQWNNNGTWKSGTVANSGTVEQWHSGTGTVAQWHSGAIECRIEGRM
jgi:hypothetical protein